MKEKQTAGNNPILKGVKRLMNGKIFAKATEMMNSTGEVAAIKFVNKYTTIDKDGLIAIGNGSTPIHTT